jgi:hypothetical protein
VPWLIITAAQSSSSASTCYQTSSGVNTCLPSFVCGDGAACTTTAGCGTGEACVVDTFCGFSLCGSIDGCVYNAAPSRLFRRRLHTRSSRIRILGVSGNRGHD